MADWRRLFSENRWLVAMVAFTAVFYVLLSLPPQDGDGGPKAHAPGEHQRLTREDLKERESRFVRTLEENPRALAGLSLGFIAIFLGGLVTDAWLAARKLGGRPLVARGTPHEDVPWGVREVVHVFAALFFLEAAILSVEMVASLFWDLRSVNRDMLLMSNSLLRDLVVLAGLVVLVRRRYRLPLASIGLTARHFFRNVRTGLVGYLAVVPPLLALLFATAFLVRFFRYEPPPQPVVEMYIRETAPRALMFFTFFVAVAGPLMEELLFRGFAYKALRTRFGVGAAMTSTALLFAVLHLNFIAFIPIFLLGLFLNYLYERTGSLVPCMAAHMTHNLLMVGCTMAFKSLSA